jgi:hypothetical protein
MTTDFDALLDEATHPFEDVEICLAGQFQVERDRLIRESKVDDGDDRLGQKSKQVRIAEELKALQEKIADRMVTIRVYRLPGSEWAALKIKHPITKTPGQYDKVLGFNSEAVCKMALLNYGKRVETVDEVETEHAISAGQWSKILDKSSGGDVRQLFDTMVGINELTNRAEVERLGKGSRRTSASETN